MKLEGAIERVQYYNKAGGYTVALFKLSAESFALVKEITYSNQITIIGNFDKEPMMNEKYILTGEFFHDKQYGMEFKFNLFNRVIPNDKESLIDYFSSSAFEGIGRLSAIKIVDKLGNDAIQIIIKDDNALNNLGLTRKQIKSIKNTLEKEKNNNNSVLFYLNGGLSIANASKIIDCLGANNLEIVKNNPYILMEKLSYFGFKKNDEFALKIGIKKDSDIRIRALLKYYLKEIIYSTGNSYANFKELFNYLSDYLEKDNVILTSNLFTKIIDELEKDKKIVIIKDNDDYRIFDYYLYKEETAVAYEIYAMLSSTRGKIEKFNKNEVLINYESLIKNISIKYSKKQEEAIKNSLLNNIMIITGGPGTGKSTIIKGIIKLYASFLTKKESLKEKIALLAPTGRASKRLKETTGYEAYTIHRYLGYDGNSFLYNKDEPREEKLIIVDEASMMDIQLMYQLMIGINPDARVIIVGDVDQLPSIGPGQVLKDLIDSNVIPTIKLDQIHRQKDDSTIIELASYINNGMLPSSILEKKSDRSFIESNNEYLLKNILDVVKLSISKGYNIQKDFQILIPMYRGEIGINIVNEKIQDLVNPVKEKLSEYKSNMKRLRINDKIIQLVNRPEKGIMNGDIGYIESFNIDDDKIEGICAVFDDVKVSYNLDELDDITLAYAITIHKAQGSEFPLVIMPISSKHYIMLKRKLIYTAVTRAKQKLILIGDIKMFDYATKSVENPRKTILIEELLNLTKKDSEQEIKHILTNDTEVFVYNVPLINEETDLESSLGEVEYDDNFEL